MDTLSSKGSSLGVLKWRLDAVEQRLDRHENAVSASLDKFGHMLENMAADSKTNHNQLAAKIDGIESKLDHEEGARAQMAADRDIAEHEKERREARFFSRQSLRILWAGVAVSLFAAAVGAFTSSHIRLFN
jgi:hypothetical protein